MPSSNVFARFQYYHGGYGARRDITIPHRADGRLRCQYDSPSGQCPHAAVEYLPVTTGDLPDGKWVGRGHATGRYTSPEQVIYPSAEWRWVCKRHNYLPAVEQYQLEQAEARRVKAIKDAVAARKRAAQEAALTIVLSAFERVEDDIAVETLRGLLREAGSESTDQMVNLQLRSWLVS